MVYCEKCRALSEGQNCEYCGSKKVRLPRWEDYCLLTERPYMWASMLDEVLRDNGIPAVSAEVLDQAYGLRTHVRHRIYVPYGTYEEAKEWMAELFHSVEDSERNFEYE